MDISMLAKLNVPAYVSDPQTYDLLYWNRAARIFAQKHGGKPGPGCKCYEALQGLTQPCCHCANKRLTAECPCIWEYTDEQTSHRYLLQDRLDDLDGLTVHIRIAADLSEAVYPSEAEITHGGHLIYRCRGGSTFAQAAADSTPYISNGLITTFGYHAKSGGFLPFLLHEGHVHPDDYTAFEAFCHRADALCPTLTISEEIICRLAGLDSLYHWSSITLSTVQKDDDPAFILTIRDIENELDMCRACRPAEIDPITKLYTFASFCQQADLLRQQHPELPYVYIVLDIDKFKVLNESLGMAEGNRLLHFIADTLRQFIGLNGCCGHMYADVFCVITAQAETQDILALLKRLYQQLQLGASSPLRPVFGLYRPASQEELSSSCCERAGFARKFAKTLPEPRYKFYDDTIRQNLRRENRIEIQMNHALESGQFVVYMQPKYDMHSHNVVGAEALVRWNHPTRGLIPPDQFIPLFERNGFILKLDAFVWQETCRLQRQWLDQGLFTVPISVNVSRLHLYSTQFRSTILNLSERYQLPAHMLELELTESLFSQEPDSLVEMLRPLREAGFCIDMDDFGSGYSSLNFLEGLEIDVLKLDCGFLNRSKISDRSRTILRHIIAMAHDLGIRIVTEGVETPEQATLLLDYGCNIIQGFYFSAPIPAEQFANQYLIQHC